ncbi:hypothetical protein [Richelia intracellularis]|nr:hypothetical protein [Richelia intracellularis]
MKRNGIWKKHMLLTSIYLCLTLFWVYANESKISQCKRLITIVDQGNNSIETNKGYQVTTSYQLAKDLEKITQILIKSKFGDTKLAEFNDKFATIFRNWNQQIGKASKALATTKTAEPSKNGRITIKKAREEINTNLISAYYTAKNFDVLFEELNEYCNQTEESVGF